MSKKTKDTKNYLIDDYIKNKLAIKKQDGYYGIIDGIEVLLGREQEDASDNLQSLLDDGTQLESTEPVQQVETQADHTEEPKEQTLQAVLNDVKQTETEDDVKRAIQEALGEVKDLKPQSKRGNFVVYVDGIESDRWLDPKVPDNHLVKNIPFAFYWLRSEYNVEDGSRIINDNWTVLNKSLAKRMKISVHRDDTPNQPYFSVKKHVLCVARKDQYLRKKTLERLRGNVALPKLLKGRKEAARQAAAISKNNVAASTNIFAEDMTAVKAQQAQNIHVNSGGMMSVERAESMIDNITEENLFEIAQELDNAHQQNTIVSDDEI